MLYQLSYGHQARKGFYQRKSAWQSVVDVMLPACLSVSPAEELGLFVVALAFVYHAEEPRGARGFYDDDVTLGIVDLDGDAEIVSWFVLVGDLQGYLDSSLLLAVAITPELQGVVRVEAPRAELPGVPQAPEDGPDVGHAVLVAQDDGDPDHIVYRVRLHFGPISRHCNLLES